MSGNDVEGFPSGPRDLRDEAGKVKGTSWLRILVYYMIFQAIVGLIMFEWSYWKLRRFRVENDERDEKPASENLVNLPDSGVSLYSNGHHSIHRTWT